MSTSVQKPRHFRSIRSGVVAFVSCGILIGCTDSPLANPKPRVMPIQAGARIAAANMDMHPYERQQREIATRVPSFAGLGMDRETGNAVAYVVDMRDSAAAAELVGTVMADQRTGARGRGLQGGVVVRPAQHTFTNMSRWRDSLLLWKEGESIGVRMLDVDERENRVVIGVDADRLAEATPRIREKFTTAGGHPAALKIIQAPIITLTRADGDSLTSTVRPIRGGTIMANAGCTIGFVLKFDNIYYLSTAAHCRQTTIQQASGHNVAYDSINPGPWSFYSQGGWHYARWSESELYKLYDSVSYDYGRVARATNLNGALTINQSNPYIQLTAEENCCISDDWYVEHIGVVGGHRYGWVVQTCFDYNLTSENGYWVHCQFRADMYAQTGDSGGPVISPYPTYMSIGTIWGKASSPPYYWNQGVFSGFRGLDLDLTGSFNSGRLRSY